MRCLEVHNYEVFIPCFVTIVPIRDGNGSGLVKLESIPLKSMTTPTRLDRVYFENLNLHRLVVIIKGNLRKTYYILVKSNDLNMQKLEPNLNL